MRERRELLLLFLRKLFVARSSPYPYFSYLFPLQLNLACALIGSPDVILLDEPSAGLDPVARYAMGRVIREVGKNSAVLYMSHYMEQAEGLCSRIAIMTDGRIKVIGSLSRLKQRFR